MFVPGQRYSSSAEPDLGLGTISAVSAKQVSLTFSNGRIARTYGTVAAPLRRVVLNPGDSFAWSKNVLCTIISIEGNKDSEVLSYATTQGTFLEKDLPDTVLGGGPFSRLSACLVDVCSEFDFRLRVLRAQCKRIGLPVAGLVGGRVELLAYQFDLAAMVAARRLPRVLLSDETGLGKTIEACLIMHRLLACGLISRVLIIVPGPLIHQWFVELLRRFNCTARIFDTEFCKEYSLDLNPFLADQIGLIDLDLIASDKNVRKDALEAGFDLLVVDEAHHLKETSAGYKALEELSKVSLGLLLLSATPEHLGRYDHFLRLRLLDPARYSNFDAFCKESDTLTELAECIDEQHDFAQSGNQSDVTLHFTPRLQKFIADRNELTPSDSATVLSAVSIAQETGSIVLTDLIDRYGIGRSIFRNTRKMVQGSIERTVMLIPLDVSDKMLERLYDEYNSDCNGTPYTETIDASDNRVVWLASLLIDNPTQKFLVICHSKERVIRLERALAAQCVAKCGMFHEDMTLVARDRNAAWFSEPDGAKVLLCSEIGSEGRNFQFCHNLVMLDLPLDPEVLEQRIGRLDRIGQKSAITIYVPYGQNSAQHILALWYHEVLNAFATHQSSGRAVFDLFKNGIVDWIIKRKSPLTHKDAWSAFVVLAQEAKNKTDHVMVAGRDRLLAFSSFRPERAASLIQSIKFEDNDTAKEELFLTLCKSFGILTEDAGSKRIALLTESLTDLRFPLPRTERPVITFDRATALLREDIEFITIDHPMYAGALDLYVSSEMGTSSFGIWQAPASKELLLEVVFVLECVAQASLHCGRFLPPTPIHLIINHGLQDCTQAYAGLIALEHLVVGPIHKLIARGDIVNTILPAMHAKGQEIAENQAAHAKERAIASATAILDIEVDRLVALYQKNRSVRHEEIEACTAEKSALVKELSSARLRLDSCRVIWRGKGFGQA